MVRVEDLNPGERGDHDLANEAVGFLHVDDGQVLAVGNVDTGLGAANADGGDRGLQDHGIRVGLGDLAADEGENALQDRDRQAAFLRARIVDHFVEDHAALGAHGEGGLIGEHDTDATVGGRFQNVTLEDRIAARKLHPAAIGAGCGNCSRQPSRHDQWARPP